MEATSTASEIRDTLSRDEVIHCHKARIFGILATIPVVRGWRNAICDGALFVGNGFFPKSYASRYFQTSSEDISYVTFSIVTVFRADPDDDESFDGSSSVCDIPLAQREASEFLILTFAYDHDKVALLPHRKFPPNGENTMSDSMLSEYSFPIAILKAQMHEVRRITANPMCPTSTPFQLAFDGIVPNADFPVAIKPPESKDGFQELYEESMLRTIHRKFSVQSRFLTVDFLNYQSLLRDFKIIISAGKQFPDGLEAVIGYGYGDFSKSHNVKNGRRHLIYTDYLLMQGVRVYPEQAFIPRRLIHEDWFDEPRRPESDSIKLRDPDSGRSIRYQQFLFHIDDAGQWVQQISRIIHKYPPVEHPTPAEAKQELWKKAFAWPEDVAKAQAQATPEKSSAPREARWDDDLRSQYDSGTGGDGTMEHDDVSLIATHYEKRASWKYSETEEDAV